MFIKHLEAEGRSFKPPGKQVAEFKRQVRVEQTRSQSLFNDQCAKPS